MDLPLQGSNKVRRGESELLKFADPFLFNFSAHQMSIHSLKHSAYRLTHHPLFQHLMIVLIVINAVLLGMETSPYVMGQFGESIHLLDHAILGVFVIELLLLIFARGLNFFKDPWCIFDFIVIAISFVPASDSLSVLRSLRVLRVLRLINKVASMRKVVRGLLNSLSSLGSVLGLLLVVFYVSSVVVTNIFGSAFPDWFGDLEHSLFTLFQVMTLEGWAGDIARPVMEKFPYAWVFFLFFILCATFVVVNLFIAVIVDSLSASNQEAESSSDIEQIKLELNELKSLIIKQQKLISDLTEKLNFK